MNKTEIKHHAQSMLFTNMLGVTGYEFERCQLERDNGYGSAPGICIKHDMTEKEEQICWDQLKTQAARVAKLFDYDLTYTRIFVLAGEWEGLNKVIGNSESAMSMLWRTKGI